MILTDYHHLKCFVEVNRSTAEKHTDKTLLSNLNEIAVKFDALIYNLPEITGFIEFHSKCKSVLDALNQHSYLTSYMVNNIISLDTPNVVCM